MAKRVLVLGAGHVSGPLIEYLTRDTDSILVTVASALPVELETVKAKFPNVVQTILLEIKESSDCESQNLRDLIGKHQLVVSILPYNLHPLIASICVQQKVHMVTASYYSGPLADPSIKEAAEKANITILNEVGLDPGIDHMLAMECIDQVHAEGGIITGFVSYCGGLPAPEASDNVLRYRFNWAPRDALRNTLRSARYLKDGNLVEIPEGGVAHTQPIEILPFLPNFDLEATPNRDSLVYKTLYGIQQAATVLRGTLRFVGFGKAVDTLQNLGLIDLEPSEILVDRPRAEITWPEFICHLLGCPATTTGEDLKKLIAEKLNDEQLKTIKGLGLLEVEPVEKKSSPLETLSNFLSKKPSFSFTKGERDLVILMDKISIQWSDGRHEDRDISLVVYGGPNGYSAMAKTVGFTAGIAAKLILEGKIKSRGCILPFDKDVYRPILDRLKVEGIEPVVTSKFC